jgi:hypothetical protein
VPKKQPLKSDRAQKARRLDHDYNSIRARLRYLCEFLFGGGHYEMARALNVCYRHFYSVIQEGPRQKALTIRMAAQIISRLGVRAEWFLTGNGPVFAASQPDAALSLPFSLQSSFPLADPLDTAPPALEPPARPSGLCGPISDPPSIYSHAALAIFSANGQNCPTLLFLGRDAAEQAPAEVIAPLFRDRYVHFLGITLAAVRVDVYPAIAAGRFDLNHTAVTAANAGMGYGEAVALWAFSEDTRRKQSVLTSAYDLGLPVSVFAEIGEIPEHTQRAIRGAEIGAACGAAAYVDQLVLLKYFELFSAAGGGVIICAGELPRWFSFLTRILRDSSPDLCFTVVALRDSATAAVPALSHAGARVLSLYDHPAVFFSHLSAACHAAYANGGALPH